jgi:hypothetical protein
MTTHDVATVCVSEKGKGAFGWEKLDYNPVSFASLFTT